MCGIFGLTVAKDSPLKENFKQILSELFLLSESRGKEASGFALLNDTEIRYLKTPFSASDLVKSSVYSKEIDIMLKVENSCYTAIGHSRLVTNGYEQFNDNNQPVIKKNMAVVHNGIIVNDEKIWEKFADEKRLTNLDSEIIPTLFRRFYNKTGNLLSSISLVYEEIFGMTSVAVLPLDLSIVLLATNNGSLFFLNSNDKKCFVFASERFILNSLIDKLKLHSVFSKENIIQLQANQVCMVRIENASYEVKNFSSESEDFKNIGLNNKTIGLVELKEKVSNKPVYINTSMDYDYSEVSSEFTDEVQKRNHLVSGLKKCSKCILPETFPFISFDEKGVCSYCNDYSAIQFKGAESFRKLTETYRSKDSSPDCLIPFSGGRDSSFAMHYIKKELGMNPIAYSYDWGMLTDLARRNQSRMCGKLGVEHILVSADIRQKRKNIRNNVSAWLKHPHLGTIPLFMAGDKDYFFYNHLIKKQNKIELSVMGENPYERTGFKTGFAGVKQKVGATMSYSLSLNEKLKILFFYSKEFILSPGFINASLYDTLRAFASYYIYPHDYVNIFEYLPWEEKSIETLLINQYDWETDPGTITTWRIGDGTAAFYNYIYYMVAGFTENDTFRSNQIREGLITRGNALQRSQEENIPRWESLKWYCGTIGIDFESTIKTINGIKTLYSNNNPQ
ncbi:MAG: hypothetical protein ABI840_04845 [bacterium]